MKTKKVKGRISTDAIKPAVKKTNPFEIHINRSKYNVLGRQCKSDMGLPGVSKHKALQKRKKTLLQEYKMKGKSNHFIDQRIGEQTSGMTEEDRIMARFTAERMRMFNKKAMFNLSDSEVLTHRGQTLSEIERFEDPRSDDDDDEDPGSSGALKRKFVGEAHFGGGTLKKTKQDRESLIDELISESKKRKAERQKNKEDTVEATEQLDEDWKTLAMIVTSNKEKDEALSKGNYQKNDNYDIVMRQLKFEPHGQASQRLKTDEEIAREDKEQLEKLEKERLKQLREVEADKYKTHKSADDLDDGFSYSLKGVRDNDNQEDSDGESSNVSSEHNAEDKSKEEEDEEEHYVSEDEAEYEEEDLDNSEKQKEEVKQIEIEHSSEPEAESEVKARNEDCSDQSSNEETADNEDCAMDDLTDLMPSFDVNSANSTKLEQEQTRKPELGIDESEDKLETRTTTNTEESKCEVELDLPYVIRVPENYDSFKDLVRTYTAQQLNVIFERLIKSNHPSLEPENKKKMLILAEYVIQLVNEGELTWEALPTIVLHFSHIKEFNREACLKSLADIFAALSIDSTPTLANVKLVVWYTLLFQKPEGMEVLLPLSKPALTLACQITSQSDKSSTESIVVGLLCSYLLLKDAKNSSTVYTDAVVFLQDVMKEVLEKETNSPKSSQKKLSGSQAKAKCPEGIPEELRILVPQLDSSEICVTGHQQLCYCVVLLSGFIKAYRKYPQSKLLFKPLQNTLSQIKEDVYPAALKQEIVDLKGLIQVLQTSYLPPLAKSAKKPKALRQYEPSFHTVTISKFQRGLPAEKQEEQKLLHKYKHEKKGAMRELRRDRAFLANIKLKEKAVSDEQRIRKVKEIFGDAATQQGEFRKLKRTK